MVLREHFDRLYRRLQADCDLCGGLRSRVHQAEGMQRERQGLQMVAIGAARLFPVRHLGVPHSHHRRGIWGLMRFLRPPMESCESLLGFRERLVRVSHASAPGQANSS